MFSTRPPPDADESSEAPAEAASRTVAGPIGPARLRQRTWWTTVGVVYGIGAYLLVAIVVTERSLPVAVVASLGSGIAAVVSARLLEHRLPGMPHETVDTEHRLRLWLMALAAGGAIAAVGASQWAGTVMGALAPGVATAAVAAQVPARWRSTTVVAGAATTAAVAAAGQQAAMGRVDPAAAANQVLLVLAVAGGLTVARWFWQLVHHLERARRAEAELAVAEERLRFAADLHDIQGHHLQVIALHSELATRLARTDPEAAAAQMERVQQHARTALTETRELVHGYRHTSLGDELANATRVLNAAGIDGRLEPGTNSDAEGLDEPGRQLLGLVVREATTNILRHTDAQWARLALTVDATDVHLTIDNDGATVPTPHHAAGSGLTGLADRIEGVGGRLQWQREDDWFTVAAHVPVSPDQPA